MNLIKAILLILSLSLVAYTAHSDTQNGIVTLKSNHGVKETIDRLEDALSSKGMTIFTRVDHSAGAVKAGISLRPTVLLVFGNPKVGTPLMLCSQTMALDLPQKALAYEDSDGQVWLSYNDPAYLAKRHSISGCDEALSKVTGALAKFSAAAVK